MLEKLEQTISELCRIPGLSGHEQLVSRYMRSKFEELGLNVAVDTLGNTMAQVEGTEKQLTVLVTAHMDSLGLMVKTINERGFIKLERVGGIPEKTLPTLRVAIGTKYGTYVPGVIGVKSHHVTTAEEKYKVDKYQELYVDCGCDSRQEVEALGIQVGSPIVYQPYYGKLNKTRITGTSFDNRLACGCLVELAERFKRNPAKCNVVLAGTVQEEYTIRGAITAARISKPDIIVCLDICLEGSTPDLVGTTDVTMGKGPSMSMYNFHGRGTLNGCMPHPACVRWLDQTAQEIGINLQREARVGGLTELAYMQLEGNGIAGVDLDIPCRYTHTQCEVADLKDIEETIDLLEAAIRKVDNNFDFTR